MFEPQTLHSDSAVQFSIIDVAIWLYKRQEHVGPFEVGNPTQSLIAQYVQETFSSIADTYPDRIFIGETSFQAPHWLQRFSRLEQIIGRPGTQYDVTTAGALLRIAIDMLMLSPHTL
ncbi:MAG: hypothetical protein K6U09_12540 [Acidobacteriia bacterium]|nr:hypothetical protein [Terriglobia bacterium]